MSSEIYLVTGAAGFVGGHLVRLLHGKGIGVRAMVRNRRQGEDLEALGVELVEADLQNPETLAAAVKGVSGIYHIAAMFRQASLPESVFRDINAEGTRRLLDAAIAAGVPRFIHCSTVGVLGHIEHPPADERTPHRPGDIYQQTKLEGEEIALRYFREGNIKGVVIRPAMIYGPGDDRTLKLFKMIARGKFFYVGKGEGMVHWIDVRDLAHAFVLAMEHTHLNAEVYIIVGERAVTLVEMCRQVAALLGVKPPWLHLPVKPMQALGTLCEMVCKPLKIQPPIFRRRVDFFTKSRHFDGTKARRELGFEPARPFIDELSDILKWYKGHNRL